MATPTIKRFLAEVRLALVRREAVRAALFASSAGLTALVLGAVWASTHGPLLGTGAFLLTALAMVGAGAGFYFFGWLRPRRTWTEDRRVARFVGTAVPSVGSDLLSSVELELEPPRPYHPSDELRTALAESTAERLTPLTAHELVPSTGRPPRLALMGAVAIAAFAAFGSDLGTGLRNLVTAPEPQPFGGAVLSAQPLITNLEITLTPPAYTGLPSTSLPAASGDFRVLPGTKVDLAGAPALPARRAEMVFESKHPTLVLEAKAGRLSVSLTVKDPLEYRFLLTEPSGKRRVEARSHTIELTPDQPPTIELHAPADELDVAELRRIELAYVAEDDFGLSKLELVWTQDGVEHTKTLEPDSSTRTTAQHKFLWDLTEVDLVPGARATYRVDAWDNDTVSGPKRTSSKSYSLRVYSPREKHEELLSSQQELFEQLVTLLADRLMVAAEDGDAHVELVARTRNLATRIGTLVAALDGDPLSHDRLKKTLLGLRQRLDDSANGYDKVLGKGGHAMNRDLERRLSALDDKSVAQLEEDVLTLSDWLDRQRVESLLAVGDEIAAHQERLKKLLEEFKRTGSEEARKELLREIRKLRRQIAELEAKQRQLPKDVMDQFVNADALQLQESKDCLEEVAEHLEAGALDLAEKALQRCIDEHDQNRMQMEQSLADLRSDKFSESQKNLDEVRSKLADLTRDQQDIAQRADELWKRYAEQVDEAMKGEARETRRKVERLIGNLKKRVDRIPDKALTPFSKEEKDVVERRIEDLQRMLERGDIAEALSQAREAQTGLETMEAEMSDSAEHAGWDRRTEDTVDAIASAERAAKKLVEELSQATPTPDEIMSPSERRELQQLARRQKAAQQRAEGLQKRIDELAGELPGTTGEALRKALGGAQPHMQRAEKSMKGRDPSGAKLEGREALKSLQDGQESLRRAARNGSQVGQEIRDEPVAIPGADAYRAPERFREDILDAMKNEDAPDGYGDLIRRYYEELIR